MLKELNKKDLRRIKSILMARKSNRTLTTRPIMPVRSRSIISSSESAFLIIVAFDLINRFAKAKFDEGTKNNFKPPIEFVLRLANDLELLKEFVQHTAFEIDGLNGRWSKNGPYTQHQTTMQATEG